MAIRPPRIFLSFGSLIFKRSIDVSSIDKVIDPDSIFPDAETSRKIDIAVTLLPLPLSPTTPSVLPLPTEIDT